MEHISLHEIWANYLACDTQEWEKKGRIKICCHQEKKLRSGERGDNNNQEIYLQLFVRLSFVSPF